MLKISYNYNDPTDISKEEFDNYVVLFVEQILINNCTVKKEITTDSYQLHTDPRVGSMLCWKDHTKFNGGSLTVKNNYDIGISLYDRNFVMNLMNEIITIFNFSPNVQSDFMDMILLKKPYLVYSFDQREILPDYYKEKYSEYLTAGEYNVLEHYDVFDYFVEKEISADVRKHLNQYYKNQYFWMDNIKNLEYEKGDNKIILSFDCTRYNAPQTQHRFETKQEAQSLVNDVEKFFNNTLLPYVKGEYYIEKGVFRYKLLVEPKWRIRIYFVLTVPEYILTTGDFNLTEEMRFQAKDNITKYIEEKYVSFIENFFKTKKLEFSLRYYNKGMMKMGTWLTTDDDMTNERYMMEFIVKSTKYSLKFIRGILERIIKEQLQILFYDTFNIHIDYGFKEQKTLRLYFYIDRKDIEHEETAVDYNLFEEYHNSEMWNYVVDKGICEYIENNLFNFKYMIDDIKMGLTWNSDDVKPLSPNTILLSFYNNRNEQQSIKEYLQALYNHICNIIIPKLLREQKFHIQKVDNLKITISKEKCITGVEKFGRIYMTLTIPEEYITGTEFNLLEEIDPFEQSISVAVKRYIEEVYVPEIDDYLRIK